MILEGVKHNQKLNQAKDSFLKIKDFLKTDLIKDFLRIRMLALKVKSIIGDDVEKPVEEALHTYKR